MSYSVSQSADFVIFVFGFLQAILTINDLKNKIYILIAVFACIAREKPEEDMTKSKLSKILVLVLAITLFALALSACNIFDSVTKVTNVDISVESGLVDSNGDGVYEVTAGGQFKLTVDWHNILINNPTIRWFVAVNNGEKKQIDNAGDKTLTQTVVGDVGTRYSVSASVNSVDSKSPINITIVEAQSGGGGGNTPSPPSTVSFTVGVSGITDTNSNGYAEAKFGKSFTVAANTSGLLIADPTFDWFVKEDSEERKLEGTASSFTFTISSREIAKYEFRAVLKGDVDSPSTNSAKVEFVDSEIENPTITCSSHAIAQGKIQQNILDSPTNVVLVAGWNEDELSEDLVTFAWYVDNVLQSGETNKTYTYNVSGISTACEKVVKLKVSYKARTLETTITLSFVEEYLPISKVSLEVSQTSTVKVAYSLPTTYKVTTATTSDPGTVTVSAVAHPDGTDLTTDCTWTVRDMSGARTLSAKTRSVEVPLAYGKNVITATIQNMESRSVIVYALTAADLSERAYAIQQTFVWDGSVQDHYINNQEELNNFVGYLVSTHATSANASGANVHDVYLAPSEWKNGSKLSDAFNKENDDTTALAIAMQDGIDESGSARLSMSGTTKIWLSNASVLGEPSAAYTPATVMEQRNVYVRYETIDSFSSEKRSKVPADDFEETMLVKNSNQLMRALMWGYKPQFEDNAAGTKLSQLYTKAKSVLLKYIGKNMTELEKVQIIYEWLVNDVVYDYGTAAYVPENEAEYEASVGFYGYYLEGVFNFVSIDSSTGWDARAVCDGKSKAFALLCGMEGIRSMRIIGTANGGGHAWNKVLIDVDGDGVREWFFVDCTWGDNTLNIQDQLHNDDIKETLTYKYFLTTDAAMSGTHVSTMAQPVCDTAYNPYEDLYVKVSSTKTVSQYVTSLQQLKDLRDYSSINGGVMIQVKLDAATEAEMSLAIGLGKVPLGDRIYYIYGATN